MFRGCIKTSQAADFFDMYYQTAITYMYIKPQQLNKTVPTCIFSRLRINLTINLQFDPL